MRIASTATPISQCSDMPEAAHTAEEENAVEVVKSEAEIGENETTRPSFSPMRARAARTSGRT